MPRRRRRRHDDPAVTRDVDPAALVDLLDGRHRTGMAWATDQGPVIRPARARLRGPDPAVLVEASDGLDDGREVVVVADDGVWWYDLRAVFTRATLRLPVGGPGAGDWVAVEPVKVVAWDYGQLRAVDDAT